MFRILGFILGSAVSIAGILLVLGVPEFHLSNFENDQARFDAALEKIKEKRPDIEEIVDGLVATSQQRSDPPADTQSPPDHTLAATEQESATADNVTPLDIPFDAPEEPQLIAKAQDLFNADQQWYEFWNPFRSEIAARGFVTQLEKVTGLDYRIIKVKAGVYQVGFAYADDDERQIKLSRISAATGLDLPET